MEYSIELLVGLCFFIIGLSLIFNPKEWLDFINYAEERGSWVVMAVGIVDLLFGESIVCFHWVWHGLAMITTIVGIILFTRGFMRMVFPRWVMGKIYNAHALLILWGVVCMVVSSAVLYGWWNL